MGRTTIVVDDETKALLTEVKGQLMMERKKTVSFNDTIKHLALFYKNIQPEKKEES